MDWVRHELAPRDERTAARTGAWIYLVSSAVVFASNLTLPPSGGTHARIIAFGVPLPLLIFGALLAVPRFRHKSGLILLTPFFGVGVVVFLDLATKDGSAGAQAVFSLPVLFAASQLRFLGATLTAFAAIAGDAIVVEQLLPNNVGVLDLIDVALVVCLMTGLLVNAGRRQDRLVALLESQASLDPLTGLVTRRVLDQAVQRALTTPLVHAGTALVLVDVDHFKAINDGYGHPVGDDALVHVATLLAGLARPDTVISRLGGDEIAVLIPGCTESVAQERAHEFLAVVHSRPLLLSDGAELPISISIGVGHAPHGHSHLRDLYAAADASLYRAKRAGRGRVGRPDSGYPVFEDPPPTLVVALAGVSAAGAGSEGLVHGSLEMGHVPGGVLESDVGLADDDRIDHR